MSTGWAIGDQSLAYDVGLDASIRTVRVADGGLVFGPTTPALVASTSGDSTSVFPIAGDHVAWFARVGYSFAPVLESLDGGGGRISALSWPVGTYSTTVLGLHAGNDLHVFAIVASDDQLTTTYVRGVDWSSRGEAPHPLIGAPVNNTGLLGATPLYAVINVAPVPTLLLVPYDAGLQAHELRGAAEELWSDLRWLWGDAQLWHLLRW